MKKIANILLLMGVLLMALSCIEAEGLNENPEGEITMSPVLSQMARTRAGGTTDYPKGSSFGVFAYYNGSDEYLENHQFTCNDDGCTGTPKAYWPLSGSLIFAGYSPFDEGIDAGFDVDTKTFTIRDYVVDGKKDLMYFLPELDGENYVSYDKSAGSVDVEFHHALSCVSFNVFAGSGGGEVKLTQICLGARSCSGDFSVEVGGSGVWGNLGSDRELIVWEAENADGLTLLPSTPLCAEAFVIPGNASSITVSYKIGDESKSKSFSPEDTWYIGKNNIYNISIDSQEAVIISPSVSFSHKYSDGVLVGSQVSVDLGLSPEKLRTIKDFNVNVKVGDEVYKSFSTGEPSNKFTFDSGSRLYLPRQNYTVVFTYNDGIGEREVPISVDFSEEPIIEMDVKVLTRPTSVGKSAQIVGRSVSLTISDAVLAQESADVLVQIGSSPVFDIRDMNTSYHVNNQMTPVNVSPGSVKASIADVVFGGFTISFDKTFYVASSYTRSSNPISKASDLEDGCKYAVCLRSSMYYWVGGISLMSQSHDSNTFTNPDYMFIYLKDDSKKAAIDSHYRYTSAGAWVLNYDWKYLSGSFAFTTEPSYFTCASSYNTSLTDQKIYIFHQESPSYMMSWYDKAYSWGFYGYDYCTWSIYKLEEN